MEDALYDVYLAQALIQTNPRYSEAQSRDSLLAGVLAKHEITRAQFDSSIVWYSGQGEVYFKINDHVSKRLRDLQQEIVVDDDALNQKSRAKYNGFTLPPSTILGGKGNSSFFSFNIDSLKFGQIDTTAFDFNFRTLGILPQTPIYASVSFEYKDTTINVFRVLSQNSYYSIKKPFLRKHKLKNISGYIRVDNPKFALTPIFVYDLHYKKVIEKPRTRKPKSTKEKEREAAMLKMRHPDPKLPMGKMEK